MHRKFTLKNGVRVVYERIPYVRSVSAGIWVRTGSRNENSKTTAYHTLSSTCFSKGTRRGAQHR